MIEKINLGQQHSSVVNAPLHVARAWSFLLSRRQQQIRRGTKFILYDRHVVASFDLCRAINNSGGKPVLKLVQHPLLG
jgi:hypothetical protein